jgi:8-oxo-dGTP diphosphatase
LLGYLCASKSSSLEKPGHHFLNLFGNTVRVRSCGICISHDRILLAGHRMPGHQGLFWAPPGGGVVFGESLEEGLKREFFEECGLQVGVGELLFVNEFIRPPLHAIEFFFEITSFEGQLLSGYDPEMGDNEQILEQVRFMSLREIQELPEGSTHRIMEGLEDLSDLVQLKGFLKNRG